ncbi:hypothetical protein GCM10010109_87770 [Actinoplanes campanulatus]|nr:hypothetical protein GCM10010109_87770 [Actinoplanes campanulatus]GID42240.1 hypothetical protein Aca09nite_87460 [Actinoplanes campanulatus]
MLPAVPLTSPVPPLDLVRMFPGVEAFARTATRLHPRPGTPSVSDSHVGGMLLWPRDEPWPACPGPHVVRTEIPVPPHLAALLMRPSAEVMMGLAERVPGFRGTMTTEAGTVILGTEVVSEPTASPLVAVAQLRAADVPDLRCPSGADVLQVLWCPNDHPADAPTGLPMLLKWRTASSVVDPLDVAPAPVVARDQDRLPRPCVLHPEQVTEYPWWQELPDELGRRIRDFDDTRGFGEDSYFSVSQAPGWKVGGCPSWEVSDPRPMDCPRCHRPMELLLTIDSTENRGGDAWLPVEESHLRTSHTDHTPTGVTVGRFARLRIFVCLICPDTPMRQSLQ